MSKMSEMQRPTQYIVYVQVDCEWMNRNIFLTNINRKAVVFMFLMRLNLWYAHKIERTMSAEQIIDVNISRGVFFLSERKAQHVS